MRKSEFDAEGIRLDTEFQRSIAVDMIRSGKVGGKKRYFKDSDGTVTSRKTKVWARVTRTYPYKKADLISPALPQEADVEDTIRTRADKELQIEHLQYRYHKCRDLHSGEPLAGEDREEWTKGKNAREDWIQEKKKSRSGGDRQSNTIKALTEIFAIVSQLDENGLKEFHRLVPTYREGCEKFYPEGGRKLTEV